MAIDTKVDRFVGAILAVVAILLYIATPSQLGGGGELGALSGLFPKIALAITAVLSIALSIVSTSPKSDDEVTETTPVEESQDTFPAGRLVLSYLFILGYIWLIGVLGYYVSTMLFLIAFSRFLGERRWVITIVLAIAITVGINLLAKALYLSMPVSRLSVF